MYIVFDFQWQCHNSYITAGTNLNGFETVCSLILMLSKQNVIHQRLMLTAVPVSLGAGVAIFLSGVYRYSNLFYWFEPDSSVSLHFDNSPLSHALLQAKNDRSFTTILK